MDEIQHPDLREMLQATTKLHAETQRLWSDFSSDQLLWKPDAKSWGVADCLEHLVVTHDLYAPKIQVTVERGSQAPTPTSAPIKTSFFGRLFLKMVDPDYKGKNPAPKNFQPTRSTAPDDLDKQFADRLSQLEDFIRQADGFDFNKVKVSSPVTSLLRFRLGECLLIQVRHHQRHFQQALRVTQHSEFPASA